jgi:hypothetical protein
LASSNAFAGDVKVFEHTPSITKVWLNGTHCAGKTLGLSWTTGDVSANYLPQQNSLHEFLAKLCSAKLPSSSEKVLTSPFPSFPHLYFADQSANDASPNVPNDSQGDIGVLANCKSLSVFAAAETKISGKKFPAPFICEPVR